MDGEIEGKGTKTWPDGRRYEGGFSRGEAAGQGCFTATNGESYIGTWAQNKRHGQGKLVLPDGQGSYVGEFRRHRYSTVNVVIAVAATENPRTCYRLLVNKDVPVQ